MLAWGVPGSPSGGPSGGPSSMAGRGLPDKRGHFTSVAVHPLAPADGTPPRPFPPRPIPRGLIVLSHAWRLIWRETGPCPWTGSSGGPSDGASVRAEPVGQATPPMNDVTRILSAIEGGDP